MAGINVTDNNVIEVIKAVVFAPKALDLLIDTFMKQVAILGRNQMLEEDSKSQLRALFISDSFLSQFTGQFKALFTDEEISRLLEIYKSRVMKKMLEHAKDLFDPLYHAMRKQVEEIAG